MDDHGKVELRLFGPLGVVVAMVIIGAIAGLFAWAHAEDTQARRQEEILVVNGIQTRMEEIEHGAAAELGWDEAVAHLDNHYDPQWAESDIGIYFNSTAGLERAFVLNGANQPIYAMAGGATVQPETYGPFTREMAPMIARVRAMEASRGPFHPRAGRGKSFISKPIQSSDIVAVDGQPFILTATLVQPDFGTVLPAAQAPIVVTGEAINANFVNLLARRFMLKDASFGTMTARGDHAYVFLRDGSGPVIGALNWVPQRPGAAFLKKALPVLLLILTLLSGLAFGVYRRGRAAASSLMASEARAKHMAYHDALTGLTNRAMFSERLAQATELARRGKAQTAVLCVDLDRFKEVNDSLGHQCGDELIEEAGRRLKAVCRTSDTLSRLGGDEFAIIQNDDAKGAAALATRIVEALNGEVELSGGRVFLGASVGVTLVDGGADGAEALRQADVALYRAKAAGRGQYAFFEPEMDAAMKVRRAIEHDLRAALANDELYMAYQPQMDAGGKMFGVEALVRWDHPERGPISPSFFVPIAEDCGLIDQLGHFTLHRAFTDSHRWPNLKIAVNVSARQIAQADFPAKVSALLAETKANPKRLELELTEGVLLGDDPQTHQVLGALRAMGFTLALDDFGTGYSSLAYLNRYPIDKIKIDRSFITNLGVDAEADVVVKAIVKLARALNLAIIAEGVETLDQKARLSAAGCTRVQGYIYSPAVLPAAIDGMVRGKVAQAA